MLDKAHHAIVIMEQLKSPNFLTIFKNVLVQRMSSVEATEYMPLNFILTWSTHDILLINSETTFSKCGCWMLLSIMITRRELKFLGYTRTSFSLKIKLPVLLLMWDVLSQMMSVHLVSLITFRAKHINKNKLYLKFYAYFYSLPQYNYP